MCGFFTLLCVAFIFDILSKDIMLYVSTNCFVLKMCYTNELALPCAFTLESNQALSKYLQGQLTVEWSINSCNGHPEGHYLLPHSAAKGKKK